MRNYSHKSTGINSLRPSRFIETELCIYMPIDCAITDSDDGVSPVKCQAIVRNIAGLLLISQLVTYLGEICIKHNSFPSTKCTWQYHL